MYHASDSTWWLRNSEGRPTRTEAPVKVTEQITALSQQVRNARREQHHPICNYPNSDRGAHGCICEIVTKSDFEQIKRWRQVEADPPKMTEPWVTDPGGANTDTQSEGMSSLPVEVYDGKHRHIAVRLVFNRAGSKAVWAVEPGGETVIPILWRELGDVPYGYIPTGPTPAHVEVTS